MKTLPALAPKKKSAKKPPRTRNAWVGGGEGKMTVRPGVDLTKPTLPPGKYL